jgi:hypothetical protein
MEDLPLPPSMERTNINSNNTEFATAVGTEYSYTCKDDRFLVQTFGYPEESIVECVEPENYQNWEYNIWTKGVWENKHSIMNGCFDPDRCYSDPPALPIDRTVGHNYIVDTGNLPVGAKLEYFCMHPCNYKKYLKHYKTKYI